MFVFVHIPPIFSVLLTYSLKINSLLFDPPCILFRLQGRGSKTVRSLSLAQQLATHYRVTFAKSQALIRLSTIYFLYVLIITLYKGLANPVWFYVVRYVLCQVCNTLADS